MVEVKLVSFSFLTFIKKDRRMPCTIFALILEGKNIAAVKINCRFFLTLTRRRGGSAGRGSRPIMTEAKK